MFHFIEKINKIKLPFLTPLRVCFDIGTSVTRIGILGKGIVLSEATCAGLNSKNHEYIFFGDEALSIIGKTPEFLKIIKPVVNGVISDFDTQVAFTKKCLERSVYPYLKEYPFIKPPLEAVSSIPHLSTEIEQKALAEVLSKIGFSQIYIIEKPLVTAVGAGFNIFTHRPHLIIDMGAGLVEISIISGGGIVIEKTLKNAGLSMNHLISNYVHLKYGLVLGETTCEMLKTTLLNFLDDRKTMMVRGKSLENGLPKSIRIGSSEIKEAILNNLMQIIDAVKEVVEVAPPEIVDEIYDKGIFLCGGGALIPGIDRYLAQELKIQTIVVDNPAQTTINGLMKISRSEDDLSRLSNPKI